MINTKNLLMASVLFISGACMPLSAVAKTVVPAQKFALATDGKTVTCITLAESASLPEKNAAKELADYLKQVTGADFFIVKPGDAAGRQVIAVGPGAARALVPDIDLVKAGDKGLGEDGIIQKTIQSDAANKNVSLVLTGAEGSKRGTLYAVYEFLEREVGVRWWTHTEEFVPSKPTLMVRPLNIRYKPPFFYRLVYSWGIIHIGTTWGYDDSDAAVRDRDWVKAKFAARLRNNGGDTVLPASLGGSLVPLGKGHTFYPFLPPDKYFKDHPEWYSERGGKRVGNLAQLCMTNDKMLAELTKNVLDKIREKPYLGMVHLSQNDNQAVCQCANCKALDDAEGSTAASTLYGVNKVAEAIEKEFPDFYIVTFAYQYTRKPPKTLRPRSNVLVQFCVIERSSMQPIDSEENRLLMNDLKGWAAAAPKLLIWDYTMNLTGPLTPHPNWPVFGPDFRTYRDNHAVGVFCEGESVGFTDFVAMKVYLMAHLLWDPARDEKAIMDEFLNGYYGKAGPELRQALDIFAKSGSKVRLPSWDVGLQAVWLDLAAMNRATELFQKAEASVADDPVTLARVKRARLSLDHQWLQGYVNYREEAKQQGLNFLGPQDSGKAVADFCANIRAEIAAAPKDYGMCHMPRIVQYQFLLKSFDDYLNELAMRVAARKFSSLPECFRDIPQSKIINMDETSVSVIARLGARVVVDAKASGGVSMKLPRAASPSWGLQAMTGRFGSLGGFGRYHVYAVVRCELMTDKGAAFVGGVWDDLNRIGLGAVSFPIGKPALPLRAKEIDPNPAVTFATITSGKPVTDGEYHVYDFGIYDFSHDNMLVWVGTTTGDMYVERFVFVREEMPAGKRAWNKSAKDNYTKLYNGANYVAARTYLENIDFTASEILKNQYVSFLLDLDRMAEGKKATSINSAKTQVEAYATKTGLTDQSWIEYNVLAHLFSSLADKQLAYDYFKSLEDPNIATKRFAIKVCNALKKTDEAKEISIAIGDSK